MTESCPRAEWDGDNDNGRMAPLMVLYPYIITQHYLAYGSLSRPVQRVVDKSQVRDELLVPRVSPVRCLFECKALHCELCHVSARDGAHGPLEETRFSQSSFRLAWQLHASVPLRMKDPHFSLARAASVVVCGQLTTTLYPSCEMVQIDYLKNHVVYIHEQLPLAPSFVQEPPRVDDCVLA
eukprot:8851405-Pyramimonas_sp.AAC.1